MLTRRTLVASTMLAGAAALSACAVSTQNGVTTVTVNVAQAVAYASGAAALAAALLGLPGVSAAIGAANLPVIENVLSDINSAVPAVQQAAGNTATFTFDTTSAPAFVQSLLKDMGTLQSTVAAGMTALGSNLTTQVTNYYNGLVSVANALTALLSISASAALDKTAVTNALALVHIKAP